MNLLLITAIVGLSISVYRLGREVVPLRSDNKRLNEERGTLVFSDPAQVHAIHVPTRFAANPGTFRVFIPEGKTYVAIVAVNDIPKEGLPEVERRPVAAMSLGQAGRNAFATLSPGEHVISLSVRHFQDVKGYLRFAVENRVYLRLTVGNFEGPLDMTVHVPKGKWPEVEPDTYAIFGDDGVQETTKSVASDQPLVLLRHRLEPSSAESLNVSYVMPEPDYPLDGMMLWIEPLSPIVQSP